MVQAYDAGIKTESIVFSDTASEADLRSIMVWLRHLEYHHVFVICFEDRVEAVMTAAVSEGVVGRDFFYVFPCFDVFTLQENLMFKHGKQIVRSCNSSSA